MLSCDNYDNDYDHREPRHLKQPSRHQPQQRTHSLGCHSRQPLGCSHLAPLLQYRSGPPLQRESRP